MRNEEIRLELSLEEDLPAVIGDPIGLQQVVNNLIQNAVEAMAEGGLLQISAQKGVLSVSEGRPVVIIRVQDTGPGITPDQEEKIFNPFFTTKHTGIGLGLSISHQIVERHGGVISLESKPDELTTFKIELPVTPKS
jgi:signal transduction histidine kinase